MEQKNTNIKQNKTNETMKKKKNAAKTKQHKTNKELETTKHNKNQSK